MPWTKMTDNTEYLKVINQFKTLLKHDDCKSISELELKLFA
jgi:hypothetical protein